MLELLRRCTPWLVAGLLFCSGYWVADNKWEAKVNNEYITKLEARENQRAAVQGEIDKVSAEWQDKMSALEGSTDRIIADLNRDNKRMRVKVNTTGITESDYSRCFPDGRVELHPETSKSLIRITQEADLKEKALQDTIRRLQQEKEK
ncbi:spanin, inner membrane subunit [Salmonella phage STP-SP1]|uniref:Spanin n=1 Tax=Salmonella phage PRF-SP1 TaxID=2873462 RepID=A0AAE8XH40_9CAUD|nr:spanin [Salmonella phage PRF-SP1]UFZ20876.1 spanin [Salmonella phage PRF-SP3]UIS44201.1 spanin inner membrane subunit [Salmonella phage PRF-SP4]UIS44220.1 spanin inner membrane subunit [Salmonella phage PRF-SP5]UOL48344.1 spanin [Salmonella phage PRF-SP2]WNO24889.1 spanin [Salmonella phage PRF-SP11]WOZ56402.1 spanin inner membrane subunit [Salmonella phage PRF-SP9]WOZ56409.1 spanin inner membrane subunit [Salmonella phage PRF-SP10]WPJ68062.1 spanin inner membrane subunit [Salmonella phag